MGPAAQIEGHKIWEVGREICKPTKMAAHLLLLLEIKFLQLAHLVTLLELLL